MSTLSTTKMSSKGQIVIPEEIRNILGLLPGDQFLVVGDKDVVILRMISKPSLNDFDTLIKKARSDARKAGLTKLALKSAIKQARNRI